eukprot:7470491-Pyramimonas_sp.AAC.1
MVRGMVSGQIESLKRQLADATGGGKTEIKMLRMELETARKNLAERDGAYKVNSQTPTSDYMTSFSPPRRNNTSP